VPGLECGGITAVATSLESPAGIGLLFFEHLIHLVEAARAKEMTSKGGRPIRRNLENCTGILAEFETER